MSEELIVRPKPASALAAAVTRWLNRDMPEDRWIELRIGWPLLLIPIMLVNQLVAPHLVWVVLIVALSGFYLTGYWWVKYQTPGLALSRKRVGALLVAGDMLQEEFELRNRSHLPVLWAEFIDHSNVPDYNVGRIVACEGDNAYRWRTEVLCKRRGMFRLGPHLLRTQDPLGLFAATIVDPSEDIVLIYPRVVHLPRLALPHGNTQGGERQQRPMLGHLPAATVSDYQPGDSLRHVHWISTARRGRMMVKDLEIEPGGNIWLVLDLEARAQQGEGAAGTLEQGIVVAASLAAELLSGRDQRSVGLLAFSGEDADEGRSGLVHVAPGMGSAHTWSILSALAPVAAGELPLGALLASSRTRIGRRGTLAVVTPVASARMAAGTEADSGNDGTNADSDWVAELVHMKSFGIDSSVVLIAPAEGDPRQADAVRALLARMDIPCSVVVAGTPLSPLLTFRRRRRIVRSTPTGGAVTYEVDEEVG